MKNRRLISLALFVLAAILLLTIGLAYHNWIFGVLVGLILGIGGVIFYRRGK